MSIKDCQRFVDELRANPHPRTTRVRVIPTRVLQYEDHPVTLWAYLKHGSALSARTVDHRREVCLNWLDWLVEEGSGVTMEWDGVMWTFKTRVKGMTP